MKVELKKLELTNYRNIKHATCVFDGNSKIVGENRIGKTNTLEAIVWLLTDKLLNGGTDIASIKPLEDTKLEVRIEGTFDVDGHEITLAKKYGEDWVKTRGTEDLVFKGHYLQYFYNGVLQKTKKDYMALFLEDFGIKGEFKNIDLVQMLVDPFYIGNMGDSDGWKDLRTFIINLIGDVQDSDVFAKDPTLRPLEKDLTDRMGRVEEVKKYYLNTIKGYQEQIIGVDAQIEMLENTSRPSEEELAIARKGIETIDEEIASLQGNLTSDAAIVDLDKQINEKNRQINVIQKEDALKSKTSEYNKLSIELNDKYRNLLVKKASIGEDERNLKTQIENLQYDIEQCGVKREGFIKRLREIDEELSKPFAAECPICGRPLEGMALQEARAKVNVNLLSEKDIVMANGKKNKEEKETCQKMLEQLVEHLRECESEYEEIAKEIDEVLSELAANTERIREAENHEPTMNPKIVSLMEDIKNLENQKKVIKADNVALDSQIRSRVAEKVDEKAKYQSIIDDNAYYERQLNQLKTIKQTKKDLVSGLAKTEQKKELLNLFIKTKLEMLDDNVARVFGNIKFQLIKENINGGYDAVCKPYIYDIDKDQSTKTSWRSGSKSERVITGIAICEHIKAALGLSDLPFLFDEGGEISTDTFETKFKTQSQLICVKVMDNITTPMVMKI